MYAIEPTAAVVVSRPACTFSFFLNNNKLIRIITYKLKLEKVLLKFFFLLVSPCLWRPLFLTAMDLV